MPTDSPDNKPQGSKRALVVTIGIFKIAKACLMLMAAAASLELSRPSVNERLRFWSTELGVGPYHRKAGEWLGEHVLLMSHGSLFGLALGALLYAGLFFTEGIGLVLDKLWAEWLAVISTGLLLIPETYEAAHRKKAWSFVLVALNAAVVVYLYLGARRRMRQGQEA